MSIDTSKLLPGVSVRFAHTDDNIFSRQSYPEWYPPLGTVGRVVRWIPFQDLVEVRWPAGTVSLGHEDHPYEWAARPDALELVEEGGKDHGTI